MRLPVTGGAPALGVVELTVALHDANVGRPAYLHKILNRP
jgi:hypothetical protein